MRHALLLSVVVLAAACTRQTDQTARYELQGTVGDEPITAVITGATQTVETTDVSPAVEAVGTAVKAVAPVVPPPWGLIAGLGGSVITALGGAMAANARKNRQIAGALGSLPAAEREHAAGVLPAAISKRMSRG